MGVAGVQVVSFCFTKKAVTATTTEGLLRRNSFSGNTEPWGAFTEQISNILLLHTHDEGFRLIAFFRSVEEHVEEAINVRLSVLQQQNFLGHARREVPAMMDKWPDVSEPMRVHFLQFVCDNSKKSSRQFSRERHAANGILFFFYHVYPPSHTTLHTQRRFVTRGFWDIQSQSPNFSGIPNLNRGNVVSLNATCLKRQEVPNTRDKARRGSGSVLVPKLERGRFDMK